MRQQQEWLSTADVARALGVSRQTVYRIVKEGNLTPYTLGQVTRYWHEDVRSLPIKKTEPRD